MKNKTTDPAFPLPSELGEIRGHYCYNADGLTVRQYVASQALAGILAGGRLRVNPADGLGDIAVDYAILYADNLLKRLEEEGEDEEA